MPGNSESQILKQLCLIKQQIAKGNQHTNSEDDCVKFLIFYVQEYKAVNNGVYALFFLIRNSHNEC